MSYLSFSIFGIFRQFLSFIELTCLVTLFHLASAFQKSRQPKSIIFGHFLWTFVYSKCKWSSLHSQYITWDFFCDFQTLCNCSENLLLPLFWLFELSLLLLLFLKWNDYVTLLDWICKIINSITCYCCYLCCWQHWSLHLRQP